MLCSPAAVRRDPPEDPPEAGVAAVYMVGLVLCVPRHFASWGIGAGAASCFTGTL